VQILPDDSYRIGTDEYDGVFHCRFWRLGRWYDVYVDDYLPVCVDTRLPWGARSVDPDEMWVALIEKAFARYSTTMYMALHCRPVAKGVSRFKPPERFSGEGD